MMSVEIHSSHVNAGVNARRMFAGNVERSDSR